MKNVDFARTVLILLVVLGHSLLFWGGDWIFSDIAIQAPVLGHIADWIGTYHTQALTAISGFTYEFICEKRGGYMFHDLLAKKVKRLLVPYVLISIFWVIPLTSLVVEVDTRYVIDKFVLGKSPAQLWFLLMLFDVFVLFHPLRLLVERSKWFYLVFPLLYFGSGLVLGGAGNYFQIPRALQYVSFFALGHAVYRYRDTLSTGRCNLRRPWVLALLLVLHVAAFLLYLQHIPRTATLLNLFMNFGGCLAAVAILLHLGNKVGQKSKLLTILSRHSFAVYLLHQQIIYFTLYYLNGLVCPALHAAINFVVSLAVSLLLSVALHKMRIARVYFLGEKK